jgi:hypothetical protein
MLGKDLELSSYLALGSHSKNGLDCENLGPSFSSCLVLARFSFQEWLFSSLEYLHYKSSNVPCKIQNFGEFDELVVI